MKINREAGAVSQLKMHGIQILLLDNSQLPFISISSDAPEYKIGYNTLRIVIDGDAAWSNFRDKQKNGVYCSDELNGVISV